MSNHPTWKNLILRIMIPLLVIATSRCAWYRSKDCKVLL